MLLRQIPAWAGPRRFRQDFAGTHAHQVQRGAGGLC
jgi:hypothetical protein